MKSITTLLIPSAALLLVAGSAGAAADEDPSATIKEIRKLYAAIDGAKPLSTKVLKFDLEGDPMEGTLTKYTYEGGLTALKLSYVAGDHGGSDEHFYYHEGAPFFLFIKDQHWTFAPDGTAEKPSTIDVLTESRYYLSGDRCVRALRRTARDPDPKRLAAEIAKEEQEAIEPDERFTRLLKRAKALPTLTTETQLSAYFAKE